jgi:REP element-mobilizing transposase RayT
MTLAKISFFLSAVTDRRYSLLVPGRLRRLEWLSERNPNYFVTATTRDRAKILAKPAIHEALQSFAEFGPDHGAWLGAYVLMPDHFHAFVALDDREISLSAWAKSLKNALSKALRQSAIESPHWQKGFFDHVLRSAESYSEKWHYVRENPVRAGFVTRWEDWPYLGEPHLLEYRKL